MMKNNNICSSSPTELDRLLIALQYLLDRWGERHGNPQRDATGIIVRDLADEILNDHIAPQPPFPGRGFCLYGQPLRIPTNMKATRELASLVAINVWLLQRGSVKEVSKTPIEVESPEAIRSLPMFGREGDNAAVEFGSENLYFADAVGQRYFAKVLDSVPRTDAMLRELIRVSAHRVISIKCQAPSEGLPCGECEACEASQRICGVAVNKALRG